MVQAVGRVESVAEQREKSQVKEQWQCMSLQSLPAVLPRNKVWVLVSVLGDPASLLRRFTALINTVYFNTLQARVKGLHPAGDGSNVQGL